jgi:hypothetical protein
LPAARFGLEGQQILGKGALTGRPVVFLVCASFDHDGGEAARFDPASNVIALGRYRRRRRRRRK